MEIQLEQDEQALKTADSITNSRSVLKPFQQNATQHFNFISNTFHLSQQGEVIPLLCGAVFELQDDYFCDQSDDLAAAYLEIQLCFTSDEK